MRDYGKVSPQFWTGDTGRQLRIHGHECQVLALYLLTCPSANMIGLYYLPMPTLCHETGLSLEGASEALRRVAKINFAHFSPNKELIFVPEMARFQIGESLKTKDNRVKAVARELAPYCKSEFFKPFMEKYGKAYHLSKVIREAIAEQAPSKPLDKPLRSQEQEQEQEQEIKRACARDSFETFWSAWPPHDRKRNKSGCQKKWKREGLDDRLAQVLAALRAWQASAEWTKDGGRFIPLPLTWLNQSHWESPPQPAQTTAEENGFVPQPLDALQRDLDLTPEQIAEIEKL